MYDWDDDFKDLIRDIRQVSKPQMSAGDYLWYVVKCLLVVSAVLLLAAYIFSAKAQGLVDDHPCIPFSQTLAKAKETVKPLVDRGINVVVAEVEPSLVKPIVAEAQEQDAGIPNPEAVDAMFTVTFPDDQVFVYLGTGSCTNGYLIIPGEAWKALIQKLSREAL